MLVLAFGIDKTKHDVDNVSVLLLQYDLAGRGLLERVALAFQSNFYLGFMHDERNAYRHLTVESGLEPFASGAQDQLVDFPSSVAANDGGISEITAFEELSVSLRKAVAALRFRHLEVVG